MSAETPRRWKLVDRGERWYEKGTGYVDRLLEWVEAQDPATSKGATIGWFRRYRQADGQLYAVLLTAYIFITLVPAALVMATYLRSDPTSLADHTIARLGLTGATASLVREVLTGAGHNKLGSALLALANVVIFGLGIGRVLQLAHARSWKIDLGKARLTDQIRYLTVLLVPLVLVLLYFIQQKWIHGFLSWVLAPVWLVVIVGFFVWMPRSLLRNRVTVRQVLPGAVFTVLGLIGMRIASHLVLVNWLKFYGKYYGGFGVIMAIFFWILIFATILVIAAALSPALAERRDLLEARARAEVKSG